MLERGGGGIELAEAQVGVGAQTRGDQPIAAQRRCRRAVGPLEARRLGGITQLGLDDVEIGDGAARLPRTERRARASPAAPPAGCDRRAPTARAAS